MEREVVEDRPRPIDHHSELGPWAKVTEAFKFQNFKFQNLAPRKILTRKKFFVHFFARSIKTNSRFGKLIENYGVTPRTLSKCQTLRLRKYFLKFKKR